MAAGAGRMLPDAQLTVTDVDQAIVDAARDRLVELPNVPVRQPTSPRCRSSEVGKFDAVTWHLMLHHAIHWVAALAEIARVLKPGGSSIGHNLIETRLARLIHQIDGPRIASSRPSLPTN